MRSERTVAQWRQMMVSSMYSWVVARNYSGCGPEQPAWMQTRNYIKVDRLHCHLTLRERSLLLYLLAAPHKFGGKLPGR
jgi:hypothetical protein